MTVCFCLIALLGVSVWQSGVLSNMAPGRVGDVVMDGVSNTADIESGGEYQYRTMISSFGDGAAAFSYDSPENGTFKFSIPLKGALDEYGVSDENGDILYRVLVARHQRTVDKFCSERGIWL